jgi:chromosome partitioning protein
MNLAYAFAESGKTVFAIDLDSQSNLTCSFLPSIPEDTINTFLHEECELEDIVYGITDKLFLIPCSKSFEGFELNFSEARRLFLIRNFINKKLLPALAVKPDIILLDTPPNLGMATLNALIASDDVYIPIQTQEYSKTALEDIVEAIEELKDSELNDKLQVKGIFATLFDERTKIANGMLSYIEEKYPNLLMDSKIHATVKIKEAPSLRKSIFEHAPKSRAAGDYKALALEIDKGK